MKIRRKQISHWLRELLEEQHKATGQPYNKLLAKRLIEIGIDEKSAKDSLAAISEIVDRTEGKPVQPNVNAEVGPSLLGEIPTEQLEALKAKLNEMKGDK